MSSSINHFRLVLTLIVCIIFFASIATRFHIFEESSLPQKVILRKGSLEVNQIVKDLIDQLKLGVNISNSHFISNSSDHEKFNITNMIDSILSGMNNGTTTKNVENSKTVVHMAISSDSNRLNAHESRMDKKKKKQRTKLAPLERESYEKLDFSPRNGTDISPRHQEMLLHCINQSKCITPELQLQAHLKVYFCRRPVRFGIRFYFLVREGLLLHPNVELLEEKDIDSADVIVYLPGSAPWHKTECANASYASRLIVMDEFDGHSMFLPYESNPEGKKIYGESLEWYFMYFKRSFVTRRDGIFLQYPHFDKKDLFPLTYSVAEAYIPHEWNSKREIEILCTLRGSLKMTTRLRVQEWVSEYVHNHSITNAVTSEVSGETRVSISKSYFQQMYNARIIVTVNPANWEGDFRLWESMASGALVFVDPLFVPHGFPLEDKKHVIFFSNTHKEDLIDKLDYYRSHPEESRQIAIQGYLHAMKYHRTVSMMDYVLRTAHVKLVDQGKLPSPHPQYLYTGQYLLQQAMKQHDSIRKTHHPGIF